MKICRKMGFFDENQPKMGFFDENLPKIQREFKIDEF